MNHESVIQLDLDLQEGCVLVSSPQFPLLHLQVNTGSETEIAEQVLPVLRVMVESRVGEAVALRLASRFSEPDTNLTPPPYVIAAKQSACAA